MKIYTEEFYPVFYENDELGIEYTIPEDLWKEYSLAQEQFLVLTNKLLNVLDNQGG